MTQPVLEAVDLRVRRGETEILSGISLQVNNQQRVLIRGESGSGKTTLFEIVGLLDEPTDGTLSIAGQEVTSRSERARAKLRRETIGIVYQDFKLIPDLTAWENAKLPQSHVGQARDAWLEEVFEHLKITDIAEQYPATLSGGEKQRVAIARAVANKPSIILADEPTGQLDPETTDRVISLLFDVQDIADATLLTVSHDPRFDGYFDMVYSLTDGTLTRETALPPSTDPET